MTASSLLPRELDFDDWLEHRGLEMYDLAARLYPIPRSLTGDGVRETLAALRELVPLEAHEVPSGTEVLDWTVPREWNVPTQTKPENITIAVDEEGNLFWNRRYVPNIDTLFKLMKQVAVKVPQPEIHIRGDRRVRYQAIGEVVVTCQRAGIRKVGFLTEPPLLE